MDHMDDPHLNDPPDTPDAPSSTSAKAGPDPSMVAQIASMGFSEAQAEFALGQVAGPDAAVMWLFENSGQVDAMMAAAAAAAAASPSAAAGGAAPDEDTRVPHHYELRAIISHVGKNLGSGHYVAHVRHGDAWAFCNDQKVVWSKKTPFDRGYLYVYSAVYQ